MPDKLIFNTVLYNPRITLFADASDANASPVITCVGGAPRSTNFSQELNKSAPLVSISDMMVLLFNFIVVRFKIDS
ncbi:hypothetical protein D3C86_1420050 [compost metagenome]